MRVGLLFLAGCFNFGPGPRYNTFDATKAVGIAIVPATTIDGKVAFCGGRAELPPITVTMADQQTRATTNVPADKLLDGGELSWTSSLGHVVHDPGGNKDIFVAGPDYWRLLDEDVEVTVKLAKNPNLAASITLLPTYVCQQIADVRGPQGATGYAGESGSYASSGHRGGTGRDGGPGGNGGHGPDITVDLTIAGTKKRGELIYARVGNQAFVFSDKGGSLVVAAGGGDGGAGGRGGSGGNGGDGGVRNNDHCDRPGDGGSGARGGDGGDGGDGGSVIVRVDRAYPHLAELVKVDVGGGRGGYPGEAGSAGRGGSANGSYMDPSDGVTKYCSSTVGVGQDGEQGQQGTRRGRDGRPGRSASKLESLTTLFPDGVNLRDRPAGR